MSKLFSFSAKICHICLLVIVCFVTKFLTQIKLVFDKNIIFSLSKDRLLSRVGIFDLWSGEAHESKT